MLERIEGIVIDIVRHTDRHNVVTLFTRSRGRMAFLVPVGKTNSGRLRNATLQLLAVIDADVNIRPGKDLYTLRAPRPLRLWHGIYSHPLKSALVFFISEFFSRLVRQYPADENLWNFLLSSLEILDSLPSSRVVNFHIAFLVRLLTVVGIRPPVEGWSPGYRFNMLSAEMEPADAELFRRGPSGSRRMILSEDESSFIPTLLRIGFRNMHFYRFTRRQRQEVLSSLLDYYATHLPIGSEFKSLPVLQDLFS